MKTTRYTQKPESVLIQRYLDSVHVDIAVNAYPAEDDTGWWWADSHSFWEKEGEIDLADVQQNPQNYLHYVPSVIRAEAKQKAQLMLDKLRDACPVVPVPSYREGAAVCNRPNDKVFLMAGLLRGGLKGYELADGTWVTLSAEDINLIAGDIEEAEMQLQQAKQSCWALIDKAREQAELDSALNAFEQVLQQYEKG